MQLAALFVCAPALLWSADWKPADNPLTTPWTGKVTAEHALPEYPRPQLVRPKWTNLNGLWDYAIRPKAEDRPAQFEGKLLVPFAVESALSGVKRPLTPEQRLWYRRTLHRCAREGRATAAPLRRGRLARRGLRQRQSGGHSTRAATTHSLSISRTPCRPGDGAGAGCGGLGSHRYGASAARQAGAESQRHLVYGGHPASGRRSGWSLCRRPTFARSP